MIRNPPTRKSEAGNALTMAYTGIFHSFRVRPGNAKKDLKLEYSPEELSLNLAIVGGGKSCKILLDFLHKRPPAFVEINIAGVCDINPDAEGFRLAKTLGIHTTHNLRDLLRISDLDGVIELTSSREVLLEVIRLKPRGVGILDHNIGRLLRGLLSIDQMLRSAAQQVAVEKMATDFLIQQANERIVVLNTDFSIVEANEPYLKAVNQPKNKVIGAHCYEVTHGLNAPCSSSQPELGCPMMETLRTGNSAHVIHEHPLAGDRATYCDMVTYPLKDQNGEIVRVIEIWRDITEELSSRWERRAKALKADLKKLVQEDRMISLGKLVASSVHEINNPIQGLLTFSHLMEEMLKEGEPGAAELEKFRKFLSLMSNELERCGNIISGLLSFSRQPGNEFTKVDLNEVLDAVITLTRHKMELQNIALKTELHPTPLLVHGDVNQLQQCFLNLIFNAIEVMPEGGNLNVISGFDKARKHARVTIQDSGYGIHDENLDHIFDPFFTTKAEGEGTGLGLSIVHGIVKSHGGSIKVNTQVGEGSSFILIFPV